MRAVEIEAADFGDEHFNIFVGAKNGANGSGDFRRRKSGRGDLIKQRLEGVEILAVNDRDLDMRSSKCLRGIQPAKAGAHDYHPRRRLVRNLAFTGRCCRVHLYKIQPDGGWFQKFDGETDSGWIRVVMPSGADLMFVALLECAGVHVRCRRLLGDAGIGWHIRTGQQILATHAIPRVDSFSSTMQASRGLPGSGSYDVVVGQLEAACGLNGVVWLTAVVIAAVFAWTFRFPMARGTNVLVALALTLLAISASMIHFLARPHVVSWLFALAWFWILDSSERNGFAGAWRIGTSDGCGCSLARWWCG